MATARKKTPKSAAPPTSLKIHLLDVGAEKYGECVVVQGGELVVLIDGAHPSDLKGQEGFRPLPEQLTELLGKPPFHVDLLVVTHCHNDHIGCLPELVGSGLVTATWALLADEQCGFGRAEGDSDAADGSNDRVRRLVAALREEDHSDLSDASVTKFLADAATVEPRYKAMIKKLQSSETTVVRYGRDDHAALQEAMGAVGLQVLGPTPEQLQICGKLIGGYNKDAVDAVTRSLTTDSSQSDVAIYRQLMGRTGGDAIGVADMAGKGAGLNSQSIVLKFGDADQKALVAGDMQFAQPQVTGLNDLMAALRKKVQAAGPYQFVKTLHHTSYNGLDESVLEQWGDVSLLAHSGGTNDPSHPDQSALAVLKSHAKTITYARTDRNGLVTVDLTKQQFEFERGRVNDFTPNRPSDVVPKGESEEPTDLSFDLPLSARATARDPRDSVEILIARIPYRAGRVNLGGFTVDIEPRPDDSRSPTSSRMAAQVGPKPSSSRAARSGDTSKIASSTAFSVGADRSLPPLLFVTNSAKLANNVGSSSATSVVAAIRAAKGGPHGFLDIADDSTAIPQTQQQLKANGYRGVVIVGGYDVVPSQRLDVLPPAMRAQLGSDTLLDDDNFIVWSDDAYGDTDGQGFPDKPVSRLPDAHSAAFLGTVMGAPDIAPNGRFGIRNSQRPFASAIYDLIVKGKEDLLVSAPSLRSSVKTTQVGRPYLYFMLHGSAADGTSFWGEQDGLVESFGAACVPADGIGIVLAGCCWGALTVERLACRPPDGALGTRTPDRSLALRLLAAGAQAFVGCTGSHYSPGSEGGSMGAPLHQAFWSNIFTGKRPAEALLSAKTTYLRGTPHPTVTDPLEIAKEMKILREFTCLGLGW
jgi:beta-lactamase superfamily II metal-dependent hydrolase